MSKLATVSLGQADHPGVHNTERALLNACRIVLPGEDVQAQYDQAWSDGLSAIVLADGVHTIPPLVLKRNPSSTDLSAMQIIGMGRKTILRGDAASFEAGDALISWEATAARAFNQGIRNMTLELPNVDGVKAIHYLPTSKADYNAHNAERLQIWLENLRIIGSNQYHPVFIHLEGTINRSIIRNIEGDPGQNDAQYETLLIQTDTDIDGDKGDDWIGFQFSTLERLWSMTVRGGYARLFEGRLNASTMRHAFCNGGTEPCFKIVNSCQSTIERTNTEGQSEQPAQYVLDGCEFLTMRDITIGDPNQIGSEGYGDGMQMIGCTDCTLDGRRTASGKQVYSAGTGNTKKLLVLDENSHRNKFTRFGVRVGEGGLAAEIEDNGTDNVIEAVEF